ncbi:nucleoid-associated protein YgaU [Geodermatophilus bullaregiensis]|uniref:hypothetical protein n=1 Tax=Geodermatophilus bullaregiensis TaxID=1564160 RepID=UPI0019594202|nr:hypothetical protein [Geodermatophilus bullaregiensis]MBM7805762.1 nucleoid-associated protein YgaU [Geodermatophilus bullaregiensis]
MSVRRLVGTTAAMAVVALALRLLTPDLAWLQAADGDLQHAVDVAGPEALLLTAVAALAWGAWAWGALGLVLTALSGLPGLAGAAARVVLHGVLPASARRAAALALGVGLVTTPALAACTIAAPPTTTVVTASDTGPAAAAASPGAVPDWPAAPATAPSAPPDWPAPRPGDHVVLRGECLWSIAEADLRARTGLDPGDAEVAAAVARWWSTNADVIGPDPDLLLPGQVLRPPP